MTEDETAQLTGIVGHRINNDLPVTLTFGMTALPSFSVPKQRVGPKMSAKRDEIAEFLSKHISVQYIPAVRAAESARDVVSDMVRLELAALAGNTDYEDAIKRLQDLEKPTISRIETTLADTLRELLPDVRAVELTLEDPARMRPRVMLHIDDGEWTDVALKGDGMQSLAALSLLRHYASLSMGDLDLVLAVEEPRLISAQRPSGGCVTCCMTLQRPNRYW